jgi:hypothetical protein
LKNVQRSDFPEIGQNLSKIFVEFIVEDTGIGIEKEH